MIPKAQSFKMFDKIAQRYDLLNQVLSLGLHNHWRKRLTSLLPREAGLKVLDLATGTADVPISFFLENQAQGHAYGLDLSEKMLFFGKQKIIANKLSDKITLMRADINHIPIHQHSLHCTSISFGIRNVENPVSALKEMKRVLKKDGMIYILEFSLPQNRLLRLLHLLYLRCIVPLIGFLLSGNYKAYRYLNKTIEAFAYGDNFCDLMRQSGFSHIKKTPLSWGIATIYEGKNT